MSEERTIVQFPKRGGHRAETPFFLAFETLRLLSQVAEACSIFNLEQGYDSAMVKIAIHSSDRAEHVAQYFLESPDEIWPIKSLLDDVAWLLEIDNEYIQQLRLKVERTIPASEDLKRLHNRINTLLI